MGRLKEVVEGEISDTTLGNRQYHTHSMLLTLRSQPTSTSSFLKET